MWPNASSGTLSIYAGGRASPDPSWDFLFRTYVEPVGAAQSTLVVYQARVGVNNDSPQYDLDVNGTIHGTVVTTSDVRLKKDIAPLNHALDTVSQLEGVTYDWNQAAAPKQHFSSARQIGLIAQQVEQVVPELVTTDTRGFKAVNYSETVPLLVEAIKELKQQNQQLSQRLQSLEHSH